MEIESAVPNIKSSQIYSKKTTKTVKGIPQLGSASSRHDLGMARRHGLVRGPASE